MQLAIAWGRPIEYVESLPSSTIAEFKALNIISPFTTDAQAYREGLIATLLYNRGATKKSNTKSLTDLFPYLSQGTPDWLEDERVLKAKSLLRSIELHRGNPDLYKSNYNFIIDKIGEEIELLRTEDDVDHYTIKELTKIIGDSHGEDV